MRRQETGDQESGEQESEVRSQETVPVCAGAIAHSYRKAAIGSIDDARRAGTRHATVAAAISSNMTPNRISGSRDAPGDHFAVTLLRIRLKITPVTKPPPTLTVA